MSGGAGTVPDALAIGTTFLRSSSTLLHMCVHCLSTAEAVACGAAMSAFAVKDAARRVLARAGLADARDLVGRDVQTVHFLRSLGLDPVDVLGAQVVAAAEAWTPARAGQTRRRARKRSWARPIGSHSLISAQ